MMLSAALSALAQPNTCQPRAAHPFLPIYHIIGNVSSAPDGQVTAVEDINDVSSVFLWKGVYHVFHQCCQNHWDHAVSRDLIHWTRLPPPIVPNFNPTGVPHAAGLHPRTFRAASTRASSSRELKNMVDGGMVLRFLEAAGEEQRRIAMQIGSTPRKVCEALEELLVSGLS